MPANGVLLHAWLRASRLAAIDYLLNSFTSQTDRPKDSGNYNFRYDGENSLMSQQPNW